MLNCSHFTFVGIEGGFDNNEPEYEVSYEIVILPDYVTLPFPSVELPEKVVLLYVNRLIKSRVSPKMSLLFVFSGKIGC